MITLIGFAKRSAAPIPKKKSMKGSLFGTSLRVVAPESVAVSTKVKNIRTGKEEELDAKLSKQPVRFDENGALTMTPHDKSKGALKPSNSDIDDIISRKVFESQSNLVSTVSGEFESTTMLSERRQRKPVIFIPAFPSPIKFESNPKIVRDNNEKGSSKSSYRNISPGRAWGDDSSAKLTAPTLKKYDDELNQEFKL